MKAKAKKSHSGLLSVTGPENGRAAKIDPLIYPEPIRFESKDEESLESWGFRDSGFKVDENGAVVLTGNRYSLCGQKLPALIPWVRETMGVDFDLKDTFPSHYPPRIPEPRTNVSFFNDLQKAFSRQQRTEDAKTRLRHGHGHTQFEIFAIKHGELKRIPDLVVYPETEKQVCELMQLASKHNVCLIPFGGGTCVTEALLCPINENRMIVSVDMRRLNKILWIDPVNQMACIQAGAVGRHIMEQLAQYGFTIGHEPDSVEFSTLGGWIATHASGMKKNKYGNIEDLVLDMDVVTPQGDLRRSSLAPRESVGIDPRLNLFGSEGNLGVITSAVVKIFPLPEVQKYGSILFPTFEQGCQFLYELKRTGHPPASIRLVDNLQFKFSMALKPQAEGFKKYKSKLEKWIVTRIKGFDPDKMVACTLVFEGRNDEVRAQEKSVYATAKKHGGMKAGSENGKKGYQLTYGIAYIRDFVMDYNVIAESFETSVPWDKAIQLSENVKRRIHHEHRKRGLPGKPFVTCRVTQLYDTGVCIYFYFAYYFKGVANPSQIYSEIEHEAREEVLRSGGSLSHHHGIGKLRQGFLPQIKSKTALTWIRELKKSVDPMNILGINNQSITEDLVASQELTAANLKVSSGS